MEVLNLY